MIAFIFGMFVGGAFAILTYAILLACHEDDEE